MKKIERQIAPSDVRVIVNAQYEENYGFSEGKQAWKCKGGSQFAFDVQSDVLMYEEEAIIAWVKNVLLPSHSNDGVRFIFISLEKKFFEVIDCQNEWNIAKTDLYSQIA